MDDSDSLRATLHPKDVEDSELEALLTSYFKGAQQISATEIVLPGNPKDYSLKLIYSKKHRLINIEPGPAFKHEDERTLGEQIAEELVRDHGTIVGTSVLFAPLRVTGHLRYQDRFVVRPVPDNAPQIPYMMGDHPFLIEFRYPTSPNGLIRVGRRMRHLGSISLILNAVLRDGIKTNDGGTRWVIPRAAEGAQPSASEFLQELYIYPGMNADLPDFSSVADVPYIPSVKAHEYYVERGPSLGEEFIVPENLTEILDCIYRLNLDERECFGRACYWLLHATRVRSLSRSAVFTALVSAIEALIDPVGGPKCKECGRQTGPGPTELFAAFVEHHASTGKDLEEDRRKLYAIRSALSHGGSLLPSDQETSWGLTPRMTKEWADLDRIWRVVRVSLINWVLEKGKSPHTRLLQEE